MRQLYIFLCVCIRLSSIISNPAEQSEGQELGYLSSMECRETAIPASYSLKLQGSFSGCC